MKTVRYLCSFCGSVTRYDMQSTAMAETQRNCPHCLETQCLMLVSISRVPEIPDVLVDVSKYGYDGTRLPEPASMSDWGMVGAEAKAETTDDALKRLNAENQSLTDSLLEIILWAEDKLEPEMDVRKSAATGLTYTIKCRPRVVDVLEEMIEHCHAALEGVPALDESEDEEAVPSNI